MPFPNVPEKYGGRSVLTPQQMVAYRQQAGMLPKTAAPQAVLLCLQRGLPERLSRKHPLQKLGRLNGDLFALKKANGRVGVLTNFGLGSPLMAGLAEELIAWGTRTLISISMCGSLQLDLNAGDIVVCDRAVRDEGTSHHYLPPEKFVSADPGLIQNLSQQLSSRNAAFQLGTTWTTDATFRETDIEVRQYQAEGIKTVEMETAALFAVAQMRSVPAASAFVVGDSLANAAWHPPENLKALDKSFDIVYEAAVATLLSPR